MAFYRASGNNGIESIRLDLSAYAKGGARALGTDSKGKLTGTGQYALQNTFIDRVVCVDGTMSMVYYNGDATSSTTINITTGQTVNVGNNKGVTFKWSASTEYHGYDEHDSSGNRSGALVVDVYFK